MSAAVPSWARVGWRWLNEEPTIDDGFGTRRWLSDPDRSEEIEARLFRDKFHHAPAPKQRERA